MLTPEKTAYLILDSLMSNNVNIITHLKLQKLLYYVQSWNLVFTGEKIFDSDIEAWVHGPVVPRIYQLYKHYGYSGLNYKKHATGEESVNSVIQSVCSIYGRCSPKFLEDLTHSELPWLKARRGLKATQRSRRKISVFDMQEYYSRLDYDKKNFYIDPSAILPKKRIKKTRANNIFQGIGSVLEIYPEEHSMRGYEPKDFQDEDLDRESIYSDWEHIGHDIQKAFYYVEKAENQARDINE